MMFHVGLGAPTNGDANNNASSRRRAAIAQFPGAHYSDTSFMMSRGEEDAIRKSFESIPGIDPATAEQLAEEALARDPHYRATDEQAKYGGSTPSSSFIQAVNVSPGLGMATLTLKNGRSYSYSLTPDQAAELINSDSLGRWYNANVKLRKAGRGAGTIGRSLGDSEAVGRSVAQTLGSMNPSVVSKAGLNVANQVKSGIPLGAVASRAAMGGSALGGVGAAVVAEILRKAAQALK